MRFQQRFVGTLWQHSQIRMGMSHTLPDLASPRWGEEKVSEWSWKTTLWVFNLFYFETVLSFFLEQNNRIFQTLSEVAGSADPTLTQESVRAMGLDPHGDRLFLLHLLEIYGYDTLMVSEQLCCSWGTAEALSFSSAAPLASQTVPAHWCFSGTISLTCIFTLLHLVAVAPLLHSVMRRKRLDAALGTVAWVEALGILKYLKAMDGRSAAEKRRCPSWKSGAKSARMTEEEAWRHPVTCRELKPEDWRSGNANERHPSCQQNPAFILCLCCRVLRVWIGLRLSADVAFLVSSAGFKHLYFIYLFTLLLFFLQLCVGTVLCSWAPVLSPSATSVITAVQVKCPCFVFVCLFVYFF